MKKLLIILLLTIISFNVFAQNDTTIVHGSLYFEHEHLVMKTGKEVDNYYAILNGKYYDSDKTSAKRYNLIIRHHGTPCIALITTKTKKQKIKIL